MLIQMKAFRIKLFGKFITRLPEFNLTRHEDVPLPQSFAEPYNSREKIETVQFVPSQDLSGVMIPMTGQDATERKLRKKEERNHLLKQFQVMKKRKTQNITTTTEDQQETGFELVRLSKNRLVCVPSSVDYIGTGSKLIHSALEKVLKEPRKPKPLKTENLKRKWIFSAKILFSLRQETSHDNRPTNSSLCNGTDKKFLEADFVQEKHLTDCVQEEGVEVVPFLETHQDTAGTSLQLDESNDNVSVLYVQDNITMELKNNSRASMLHVNGINKTATEEMLAQPGIDDATKGKCDARDDCNTISKTVKQNMLNLSEID